MVGILGISDDGGTMLGRGCIFGISEDSRAHAVGLAMLMPSIDRSIDGTVAPAVPRVPDARPYGCVKMRCPGGFPAFAGVTSELP